MTRSFRHTAFAAAVIVTTLSSVGAAQTSGTRQPPPGQAVSTPRGDRPAGRPGGRPPLPALSENMTPQQLQSYIDAFAVVEAERQLQLSAEQYGQFVPRLQRLQNVRRRHVMERRRLLDELNGLLTTEPVKEEAINEKVRAIDELGARSSGELRKAYEEIDALLTPVQRGKLRIFDERLERRKIELLGKIAPAQAGRAGRGGGGSR